MAPTSDRAPRSIQEPDRRDGVDGYDLDHPGLAGREIDRAVNIDPLASARFSIASFSCLGAQRRPAPHGSDAPRPEQHGFVVGQEIKRLS